MPSRAEQLPLSCRCTFTRGGSCLRLERRHDVAPSRAGPSAAVGTPSTSRRYAFLRGAQLRRVAAPSRTGPPQPLHHRTLTPPAQSRRLQDAVVGVERGASIALPCHHAATRRAAGSTALSRAGSLPCSHAFVHRAGCAAAHGTAVAPLHHCRAVTRTAADVSIMSHRITHTPYSRCAIARRANAALPQVRLLPRGCRSLAAQSRCRAVDLGAIVAVEAVLPGAAAAFSPSHRCAFARRATVAAVPLAVAPTREGVAISAAEPCHGGGGGNGKYLERCTQKGINRA